MNQSKSILARTWEDKMILVSGGCTWKGLFILNQALSLTLLTLQCQAKCHQPMSAACPVGPHALPLMLWSDKSSRVLEKYKLGREQGTLMY